MATNAFLEAVFNDASVQEAWAMYEALLAPPPYTPPPAAQLPVTHVVMPYYPSHTTIVNNNVSPPKREEEGDKKKKESKGFSAGELVGLAILGATIAGFTYGLTKTWKESADVNEKLATVARARRHVCEQALRHGDWSDPFADSLFAIFDQVELALETSERSKLNWKILLTGGLACTSCFFIDVLVNGGITRSFWGMMGVGSALGTGITWAWHSASGRSGLMASNREKYAKRYYDELKAWRDVQPSAPPML